jgi:hypothetical protein
MFEVGCVLKLFGQPCGACELCFQHCNNRFAEETHRGASWHRPPGDTCARDTTHLDRSSRPKAPLLTTHLALLFTDAPYSRAGLLSRNPAPAVLWLGYLASVHGRGTWFLFFAVSSKITLSYVSTVEPNVGCSLSKTNVCCFSLYTVHF